MKKTITLTDAEVEAHNEWMDEAERRYNLHDELVDALAFALIGLPTPGKGEVSEYATAYNKAKKALAEARGKKP